jgi:hypothetical protein
VPSGEVGDDLIGFPAVAVGGKPRITYDGERSTTQHRAVLAQSAVLGTTAVDPERMRPRVSVNASATDGGSLPTATTDRASDIVRET